ncbi:MAG: ABC transporter ATP-binding protein [Microthrixaceae bacterium]
MSAAEPSDAGAGLRAEGISVTHGGVLAVADVDLAVRPGELVGLIGPNGAGKTTTIDALSGFVPHRGRVLLDGDDLTGLPPHRRARAGVVRTWQSVELFEDLTVREHCEVAAVASGPLGLLADLVRPRRRRDDSAVDAALEALELTDVADRDPSTLSHGLQKLVGVARALSSGPRVLLLDEPAAGLDTSESEEFGRRLRSLVDGGGPGVLLVDHDTRLVLGTCDRVAVLDLGSVIASGPPDAVRDDPRVVQAYLGVGSTGRGSEGDE